MGNTIVEQLELVEDTTQYRVKLDNFEGPLDLLLHLIKEAELDIETVQIANITSQYLEYMQDLDKIDMEKASDFIDMAATLIEIKSKKVLPQEQTIELDEEDPETKLKRQIMEYKLMKEASEKLHGIEEINRLYKEPEDASKKYKIVLKDMTLEKLLDAFSIVLYKSQIKIKQEDQQPKEIVKDRFTVAEKIAAIKDAVMINKSILFTDLFEKDNTRSEIINVFLALLELLKRQIVTIRQDEIYSEIEIMANDEQEEVIINE